jgi:uncharacterized protein (DUF2461 family)
MINLHEKIFTMDLIIQFLRKLKANNNREWFHANKAEYEKARRQFEALLDVLIPEIRKFDPSLVKVFGELDGEKLTRPPKGFPADFADIGLLKYKSFTVSHVLDEQTMQSNRFGNYLTGVFREMHPLISFLNSAVK